jgi:hypothetical protein
MKSLINYFCFIVEVFFAAVFEKYSTYLLNWILILEMD